MKTTNTTDAATATILAALALSRRDREIERLRDEASRAARGSLPVTPVRW